VTKWTIKYLNEFEFALLKTVAGIGQWFLLCYRHRLSINASLINVEI